ncbi:MAG: bifunctional 2-C-methyl-D-erythritol 4-phosphate cytidylyltransferase/2-C-methyl-D-erythritol 2,4-cyclodiphosphate synthase [Desulfobulbus sp.]|nr:MAG: bifunctional 2-C-methyl-D-erythritol 4-phosphate cytidylyltransferase/2-C-methyl-D-erythritol 2,4-cyclodiphosphate synthase [Desulfobulbus sp.]
METTQPKQFLTLSGELILIRTIRCFLEYSSNITVNVVLSADHIESARKHILSSFPDVPLNQLFFTIGGDSRQQSVQNGLLALPKEINTVLVHDGARPLLSPDIIDRCLKGISLHDAVIAAVPVKDTLKRVDEKRITDTVDRSNLWQAQTPQGMRRDLLEKAYAHAAATGFTGTDEASLLEHAGVTITVVEGSEHNIKITRPGDLTIAEGLLRRGEPAVKIGHGFDAHRLIEGRKLILGGVEIPYRLGLDGHSDADVLIHALIDALLGALGAGDIGRHFPDTDATYKNIDSRRLLEKTMALAKDNNMHLGNADLTLVCQQPKLVNFLEKMRKNLAQACQTQLKNINIKATTTEKMGYTGRGEGICAHAVVILIQI